MILLWCVTSASLLVALVAWSHARRCSKRLEQLSRTYWELKYQYGELRVQMQRLTGDQSRGQQPPSSSPGSSDAFVPLTSLKR